MLFHNCTPIISVNVTISQAKHMIKLRKNEKKVENMKDTLTEFTMLNQFPLGMAYVPVQDFRRLYENLEKAFACGTIFEELYKPFSGRRCVR